MITNSLGSSDARQVGVKMKIHLPLYVTIRRQWWLESARRPCPGMKTAEERACTTLVVLSYKTGVSPTRAVVADALIGIDQPQLS